MAIRTVHFGTTIDYGITMKSTWKKRESRYTEVFPGLWFSRYTLGVLHTLTVRYTEDKKERAK